MSPEHKYLRVITQSGPSILGFLFNACAYTWALCKAHALVKQSEGEHGDEEIAAHHRAVVTRVTSSASKYLLVYLLAWTPSVTSVSVLCCLLVPHCVTIACPCCFACRQDVMLMTGSSIHTDSDMFWLVYCFQALFFSQVRRPPPPALFPVCLPNINESTYALWQGFFNSLVYFLNKKHVLKAVWQGRQSSRRVSDMAGVCWQWCWLLRCTTYPSPSHSIWPHTPACDSDAVLLRHEPDNRKDSIYDSDFYHGADAYQPPVLNVDSSFRDDYALSPASRRGALSPVLFDGRPRVASAGYALN